MASCRWCPGGEWPVVQSPLVSETGAPGVSLVWAARALLLWFCGDCYRCAGWQSWSPTQLRGLVVATDGYVGVQG